MNIETQLWISSNLALTELCACVIVPAPPKGVIHVFTTNANSFLCKWCQGQGLEDICPFLVLIRINYYYTVRL